MMTPDPARGEFGERPGGLFVFRRARVATVGVLMVMCTVSSAFGQQDTVLVPGRPPLTQGMASTVADFYGWVLGRPLVPAQRLAVTRKLIGAWIVNDRNAIAETLRTVQVASGVAQRAPAEREMIRRALRAQLFGGMPTRSESNDDYNDLLKEQAGSITSDTMWWRLPR